ncbi:MAG TPA: TonB-dependent receptor [Terriglobia bacterium]|nr:TonB-dependent receptor [Terriglobia bacterium]
MSRNSLKKLVFGAVVSCLLVLGASGTRLSAQVVKGSISGTVVDASGAMVPGVDIRAVEASTGGTYSTVSAADGAFKLSLLAIGSYTLTATAKGFSTLTLEGVGVNSAADTNLGQLKLEVGQTTTTVEVTAAPPLVEATQSQISNNISSSTITVFPGLEGNTGLDQLALQLPGVASTRDANYSNTNGGGFTVNGLRGRSNDQQIDGQANNDNSVTGPAMFVGNPDFVQEYQVTTSNFGPEYGRNSGSVVNIITRSGTNSWHGDVFGVEANSKLNTLSNTQIAFEGLTKLPVSNEEFSGFSIGGPIRKDKIFVFGGFDDDIVPGGGNFATGSKTPTAAGLTQLAGCFPNSPSVAALTAYGPFGVKGGNPVSSGSTTLVNIFQVNALGQYVLDANGNKIVACSQVPFTGVQRLLNTSTHQYDHMERVDYNGDKDKIYGRYIYQKTTPLNQQGSQAIGYPVSVPGFANQIGADWTRTINPTMVNEFRLNYTRSTVEFGGNNIGNTVPQMGNLANGLATVNMPSGYAGIGGANNLPQGRIINTYQLQDNWSWFKGKHQLKTGANLTYMRSPNVFLPNYNGSFTFSNISQFTADTPSSISITLGNPNLDFREHDSFFYFGDDWKMKSNLTLNLGLTWSYFGQPANLFHNDGTRRESGSTPFFNPSLPLSLRTFPELSSPKSNFGPSVGFAYTPQGGGWLTGNGKTVLRGGFRVAYDPPFYNIYLNIASASPQVLAQTINNTALANPAPNPQLLAQPLGPAVRNELASYLTLGVSDPRSFNETTVTPDFHSDRVYSWSFGIQREIGGHAVFESRYVANHGSDLFQSVNANPYVAGLAADFPSVLPSGITPCASAAAVVKSASGRANCAEGVIRLRTNTGVSDYEGWQNELRTTNLWNQLTLRTAYTLSKTTDNASDIFGNFAAGQTLAFSQNPFDFQHAEHGLSALDTPQAWTLSFVEQLPGFKRQHSLVGHLLGGWALSGSYILTAGQPYTPTQQYLAFSMYGPPYPFDTSFNSAFNSAVSYENLRPFLSNPKAPASQVGILAADACSYAGVGCELAPNAMLSWNALNTFNNGFTSTGAETPVDASQVRFVVNGPQSASVHATPYGDVGRNTLRDSITNTGNFSIYKYTNVTERIKVRFDATFLNVFNHPSFTTIDPFLDDAGVTQEAYGFAIPSLQSGGDLSGTGGQRQIKFGLRVEF